MTRTSLRRHLLVAGGALVAFALVVLHLGVNTATWWLPGAVVVILHLGAFAALLTLIARRVSRHRGEMRRDAEHDVRASG